MHMLCNGLGPKYGGNNNEQKTQDPHSRGVHILLGVGEKIPDYLCQKNKQGQGIVGGEGDAFL